MSDRIAVMYQGKIVELAQAEDLFANAMHPYTQALLSAIPVAEVGRRRKRSVLEGNVPSPVNPPPGGTFHPRCPYAMEVGKSRAPELKTNLIDGREHLVACHLAEKEAAKFVQPVETAEVEK